MVRKHLYRPHEELYNDDEDPYNMRNLIDDPANKTIVSELRTALYNWMKHTGDRGIITELLALEHMPSRSSGYPVIFDTILHKAWKSSGDGVTVKHDGYYTFYLNGQGSIRIDGHEIVEANSAAEAGAMRYGVIGLKAGTHMVVVKNTSINDIYYSGPDQPAQYLDGRLVNNRRNADD